jgi:hypothetical protein
MNDKLFSNVAGFGNEESEIGGASLRDNHGNSTIRHELKCADGSSYQMTTEEMMALHEAIRPFAAKADLMSKLEGEIPLPPAFESPLQTECKKNRAKNNSSRAGRN